MSESTQQLILDTAARIFTDHCDKTLLDRAERGEFPEQLWRQLADNGFNQLGSAASGTSVQDMFALVMQCGRFAVPLPMAETMLVNRWCEPGDGVYSIGLIEDGAVRDVPWGRRADKVLGVELGSHEVKIIDSPQIVSEGANLAGEPRDVVALSGAEPVLQVEADPYAQLAAARASQMAGALQAILDLGIQFATERIQFGRAISKFQAIQHSLAVVAAEVAAARRAADAAADAIEGERFAEEVAAGKARVGEAVTVAAEQVHQIHGAMGFTHEHRLHHYTRRAWAWRDEYGNEFYWQSKLGAHLAQLGADRVWQYIATRS